MPVNNKWNIDTLLKACRDYTKQTSRRISFEYAMISGVNDSDDCARELAGKLKFAEAVAICEEVLAELELELASVKNHIAASRAEMVKGKMNSIRERWSADLLQKARFAAADKRYKDCVAIAVTAANTSPVYREEANELAQWGRGMDKAAAARAERSLDKVMPNAKVNQADMQKLLAETRIYIRAGKYTEAMNTVEKAFVVNPYNAEAISLASSIYRKLYDYGADRRKADIAAMDAYAAWQWNEPTFNLIPVAEIPTAVVRRSIDLGSDVKLNNIIFPSFQFDDADLTAVLTFIQDRSKEYDPEKNEKRKGVSVGHMLTPELVDKVRVTLSLDNVSLGTLLDCLSLVTGLKYEVSTNASGLTSINFAPKANEMIVHEWDVPRNFTQVIMGGGAAAVSGGAGEGGAGQILDVPGADVPAVGGGEGAGGAGEGGAIPVAGGEGGEGGGEGIVLTGPESRKSVEIPSSTLKTYFSERGVEFPTGSAISYSHRTLKLRTVNTRANIFKIDERMSQIEAANNPLVMVEIKAVEINETDYQELGFDWTLGTLGTSNMETNTGTLTSGNNGWMLGPGINANVPGSPFYPIRGANKERDRGGTAIINNWNIFPSLFGSRTPFGSDLPLNISLTVNALAQSNRTETLSAPKIVTYDGNQAVVKMEKLYYFPESWEEIEVEVTTTGDGGPVTRITPPVPEFEEDGEPVGISFKVTPRVRRNKDISLTLDMLMSSYLGPDNYTVTIYGEDRYYSTSTIDGVLQTQVERVPKNYVFTVWRPIISTRNIKTVVEVSDGETLVLGGMVENNSISRVDKVPILGDLPLIGRFFQSQAENNIRKNMLLFVTARLIDDHGVPIKRNVSGGIAEYNR